MAEVSQKVDSSKKLMLASFLCLCALAVFAMWEARMCVGPSVCVRFFCFFSAAYEVMLMLYKISPKLLVPFGCYSSCRMLLVLFRFVEVLSQARQAHFFFFVSIYIAQFRAAVILSIFSGSRTLVALGVRVRGLLNR